MRSWQRWPEGLGSITSVAAVVLAAASVASVGCSTGDDDAAPTTSTTRPTTTLTPRTLDDLGCDEVVFTDSEFGPVRFGAATRMFTCGVDGESVHVFERAAGGGTSSARGDRASIERAVGAGTSIPDCDVVLVVSERHFVIAPSNVDLEPLEAVIGPWDTEPVVAAPTVSYLDAQPDGTGCRIGG